MVKASQKIKFISGSLLKATVIILFSWLAKPRKLKEDP